MSSPSPSRSPEDPSRLSLALHSLATTLHSTTGKEHLPIICLGGFAAEMLWHSQAEARVLRTPSAQVRKAMLRSAMFWPGLYVVTSLALGWAERTVTRAKVERDGGRGEFR